MKHSCTCCSPTRHYKDKKSLYRHQKKFDPTYVDPLSKIERDKVDAYHASPISCQYCSRVIPFEIARHDRRRKFCDKSCSAKFNNSYQPKRTRNNIILSECKSCGASIEDRIPRDFCSNECTGKHRTADLISRWKSGKELGYSGKTYMLKPAIRRWILDQANYACSSCGWDDVHPVDGLPLVEVDHIDGNPANCSPENLRVLCPNCHSKTSTYRARNKNSPRKR